jgi:hypothetical protein
MCAKSVQFVPDLIRLALLSPNASDKHTGGHVRSPLWQLESLIAASTFFLAPHCPCTMIPRKATFPFALLAGWLRRPNGVFPNLADC